MKKKIKQLLGMLLTAVVVTGGVVTNSAVAGGEEITGTCLMGDIDEDDKVTLEDASETLKYALKIRTSWSGYQLFAGDMDDNGRITLGDASKILKIALNIDEKIWGDFSAVEIPSGGAVEEANVIVVDADAQEEEGKSYKTVAGAFEYVNENPPVSEEERITIKVSYGTYREHLKLTAPYITLKGEGKPEDTVLTYYYGASIAYKSLGNVPGTSDTPSTTIAGTAHDFIAEDITFENSYNIYVPDEERADYGESNEVDIELRAKEPWNEEFETQALALSVAADRSAFLNCRMIGRQDTLFVNSQARCYFTECFIEGTADFIFGDATAVFENCTINCAYDSGYVTASGCSQNNPYGYMFKDCSITNIMPEGVEAEPSQEGDYSLGRPWNALPQIIFWNCKMDKHIAIQRDRFIGMNKDYKPRNCRLIECGTMDIFGNPFVLEDIVADYQILLSEDELQEKYSVEKHFEAKFDDKTQTLMEPDYWMPSFK